MNIGIIGYGKMGKAIEKVAKKKGHNVVFKINSKNRNDLNQENIKKIDVAIEFSDANSAFKNISLCIMNGKPVVSGTTGWLSKLAILKKLCFKKSGSFLYAPNFSIGVNLFFEINNYVAKLMGQKKYEIQIEEKHHKMKKDSPSGTAIKISNDILKNLEQTNTKKQIPIISKRRGDLKGEHIIKYYSKMDEIKITHKAYNRISFSEGAILAAEFIKNKTGFFTMNDVIKNL